MHPPKRLLADDPRGCPSDDRTVAGDLAASIRAASIRARKSVTEGYLTSPPPSPLKQAPVSLPGIAGYPLPARESMRQLFPPSSSGSYSPLPSPSKRKRPHPDDDAEKSITLPLMSPQSQDRRHLATELSGDDMLLDRPVKPLRRSGRIREVSSLSPSPSGETEMNSHQSQQLYSNFIRSTQLLSPDFPLDNELD